MRRILALFMTALFVVNIAALSARADSRIDRKALVRRNNVTLEKPDALTPLSVGNGEFAFTADITGLQTFPEYHEEGMPLGTQSQWGWHSMPNPDGYKLSDILEEYTVDSRKVPYASDERYSRGYSPEATWLRSNPHRLHLGQIGLCLQKSDGSSMDVDDLTNTSQTLDLWTGLLSSRFEVEGRPVKVLTVCHPERDLLAVCVESPLVGQKRLGVSLAFPYGSTVWRNAADWNHPERHTTRQKIMSNRADLTRMLTAIMFVLSFHQQGASKRNRGMSMKYTEKKESRWKFYLPFLLKK
ncbi:MAG: hypothetical protein PVH77_08305 [Phycisphaerales bacterium]|jgi:hypothetical protein